MDKKAKGQSKETISLCQAVFNCDPLKMNVPNKTRVAGTHLMIQHTLRNKQVIIQLMNNSSFAEKLEQFALTRDDFVVIAEIDCILEIMTILSMNHQRDEVGRVAMVWLDICVAKKRLFADNAVFRPSDVSKMWNPATPKDDHPKLELKYEQLSEMSKVIVDRLELEFAHYFPKPDDDMDNATFVDPIASGSALV